MHPLQSNDYPRAAMEWRPIDEPRPNPKNPNRHSSEKLELLGRLLDELRVPIPVVVNGNNLLLAGDARINAARRRGWTEYPVIRAEHLSPEQASLFMLADNQIASLSERDPLALGALLKELSLAVPAADLTLTGYEDPTIDFYIQGLDIAVVEFVTDLQPVQAGPEISRPGDGWRLPSAAGRLEHRVFCADALESSSYTALMTGSLAAATITDPPYAEAISFYLKGDRHRDFVTSAADLDYEEMLSRACRCMRKHMKPGGLGYVFNDFRGLGRLLDVGTREIGELKNIITWDKQLPGMGSHYRGQTEFAPVFKTPGGAHTNNIQLGRFGRNRSNLWSYPGMTTPEGRAGPDRDLIAGHPTPKNVDMIADAILDCTARGEIVLDPFLGSGTTLIAAEKTGRRAYALELDPIYVDLAIRRWRRLTGQTAIRISDGRTFDDLEGGGA